MACVVVRLGLWLCRPLALCSPRALASDVALLHVKGQAEGRLLRALAALRSQSFGGAHAVYSTCACCGGGGSGVAVGSAGVGSAGLGFDWVPHAATPEVQVLRRHGELHSLGSRATDSSDTSLARARDHGPSPLMQAAYAVVPSFVSPMEATVDGAFLSKHLLFA